MHPYTNELPIEFYWRKHAEFIENNNNPSNERIMAIQFGMQMFMTPAYSTSQDVSKFIKECARETARQVIEEYEAMKLKI